MTRAIMILKNGKNLLSDINRHGQIEAWSCTNSRQAVAKASELQSQGISCHTWRPGIVYYIVIE